MCEQIGVIERHQRDVARTNHVHQWFRGAGSVTARRQRALVLALSEVGAAVPAGQPPDLDPEAARAYAGVSRRTPLRDVSALSARGLLKLRAGQAGADRERILAFLP